MAKASNTITLTAVRDISSVTWYYLLQAGATPPAKPTTMTPPSPWQTTEPSYTAGNTNYLFVVERTVYTDNTFEYSDPSMSSSYEAAKLAYSEAQSAKQTATNYIMSIQNGSGAWITPEDKKPDSNGDPISTTRGVRITDQIDIFRGTDSVASMGDTIRIGKGSAYGQGSMLVDYRSIKAVDKEGQTYFHISDLRNADGSYTEYFTGDGTTTSFVADFSYKENTVPIVKINDNIVSNSDYKYENAWVDNISHLKLTFITSEEGVEIETAPSEGDAIEITYIIESSNQYPKAYTLGIRAESEKIGAFSVAEGWGTTANGEASHAEGELTKASGSCSHAEGRSTIASGHASHAEGSSVANARYSHAEGDFNLASGRASHAEGSISLASGMFSHAEGEDTTASGRASHAEGYQTQALEDLGLISSAGDGMHAEGWQTVASSRAAHAEGQETKAKGRASHASGTGTIARRRSQTAIGEYNIEEIENPDPIIGYSSDYRTKGNYAMLVGNGTSDSARSNALALEWDGDLRLDGDVYTNCNADSSGGTKLQTTITGGASTITSSNLTTNRALISNGSGKVAVSDTTSTELGYVHGVTSAIQTQLNNKQAKITGAADSITGSNLTTNRALISNGSGKVAVSDTTSTELGYVHGVTSAIQTQLNNKQAKITGAADSITGSNLTTNRALISNGSGKVAVSNVTSTELGYLSGVSSGIWSGNSVSKSANITISGQDVHFNGSGNLYLKSEAGEIIFYINDSQANLFRPQVNNSIYLGSNTYRFKSAYFNVAPTSGSDRTKKHNINDLSDKYEQLFDAIKPKSFMLKDGDRVHIGAISQDIEESLRDVGLTPIDFGGFCKDVRVDNNDKPVYENGELQYDYGLRYEEFIMLNTWQIQKLKERVSELEKQIAEMQKELHNGRKND